MSVCRTPSRNHSCHKKEWWWKKKNHRSLSCEQKKDLCIFFDKHSHSSPISALLQIRPTRSSASSEELSPAIAMKYFWLPCKTLIRHLIKYNTRVTLASKSLIYDLRTVQCQATKILTDTAHPSYPRCIHKLNFSIHSFCKVSGDMILTFNIAYQYYSPKVELPLPIQSHKQATTISCSTNHHTYTNIHI